jgi:hypothetical protein
MTDNLFPENPTHGMIFEQKNGVLYQYDATIKSWLKLASDNLKMSLATSVSDGAMSAQDLQKLNRLVFPVPQSSVAGNNCISPFTNGVIQLRSGDSFLSVEANSKLSNIDQYGDYIEKSFKSQIHQHTYLIDFGLDVRSLISELEKRGQIKLEGSRGPTGDEGEPGDPGVNNIISGPQGTKGVSGSAPACGLTIETEPIDTQPITGLNRALVDVRVVPDTVKANQYSIVFDRQIVGKPDASASQFNLKQIPSTWVLAVGVAADTAIVEPVKVEASTVDCGLPGVTPPTSTSLSYSLYYLDMQPIMDSIHSQFIDELSALKKSYEKAVLDWLQKMSDLFDEQKRALCCALERCISLTKNDALRQHMESVAAAAVGKAKIKLHNRDSAESVEISSTRLLTKIDAEDLCENGPEFPQDPAEAARASAAVQKASISDNNVSIITVKVDPLLNSNLSSAVKVSIPEGRYVATILNTDAMVNGKHRANVRIQHITGGSLSITSFMDKGSYERSYEAQAAYRGLTIEFNHDGGPVDLFLPSFQSQETSGNIIVQLAKVNKKNIISKPKTDTPLDSGACSMPASQLAWYEKSWQEGKACGCVVKLNGQDYIVVKRSIDPDDSCGGRETLRSECMQRFTVDNVPPAIAWPTFDGENFIAKPRGQAYFVHDPDLNKVILDKISTGEATQLKGTFNIILFPTV